MSSASMAILTIGVVPVAEMLPLLTEHIREDEIAHISLFSNMTREEVIAHVASQTLTNYLNNVALTDIDFPAIDA